MERYALQLKVSLIGIKPLIWRRVIVNADMPLSELHEVIQTIMPWDDGHLHRFYNKEQIYMMPYEECEYPGNITLKEIASFLGVTPKTVSHIRRKLLQK